MSVTSYLALYTTLLGWQQYNNLWQIATDTGLIYLPFLGIILKSSLSTFTSMGAKDAAQIAIRRLLMNVVSALCVMAFAAAPIMPLEPTVLHYDPLCTDNNTPVAPGHTGTTYDNAFAIPTGVKVPLFWYLIMAVSNGITHAASVGLPCSPINYRALHQTLDTSHITDTALKKEVVQFYNDCYVPSYSTFLSNQKDPNEEAVLQQALSQYGQDDVGWLGSNIFLTVDGYYNNYRATLPTEGFLLNPSVDVEESQLSNGNTWGKPDCKTWWSDENHGLYIQLSKSFSPEFTSQLMHIGGNTETIKAESIKALIKNSFSENQAISDGLRGYESLNDNNKGDYVSRFVGAPLGILVESLSFYPKLHLLINALPVIQGSILFALYAFLALALPFSSYRVSFCITASVVLFSIIFCSYLWLLVQWFDNYLIQALYPALGDIAGLGILSGNTKTTNQLFVEMVVGTLYVLLPMLWMTVMGWIGFAAGGFVSTFMSNMTSPAESAGQQSGNIIKKFLP